MKLVFLFGPPAVGKLTVARELAVLTGWPLFHNHLAVDAALALHEFGTPGFVARREEIWWRGFRSAMADKISGMIFTFTPETGVPQRFIDELFAEITANGGEVIPIELTASEAEIERRLGAESRRSHRKLTDLALYRQLRDSGAFATPVIPCACLRLDVTTMQPNDTAEKIHAAIR